MKNVFLGAMILLASIATVNGQNIDFGLKGGLNLSSISGSGIEADSKTGFHAGVILEVSLLETFAIQPEVLYSTQGAKSGSGADLTLDYLSVPVLAKYYLVPGTLSIDFGPQFSFLLDDNINILDLVADTDAESFELGGVIGLGVKLPLSIFAQVRYVRGITTLAENPDVNSNLFQVSVGYRF